MTRNEAIWESLKPLAWGARYSAGDNVKSFLASLAASGFAVVPVEATCEMVNAAPARQQPREDETMYSSIWRAMLAAAQEDGNE